MPLSGTQIFCAAGSLVTVASLSGIIWYEKFGSDKKRTLMNKLVSAQGSILQNSI
jgi:hypothetical protein